MFDAVYRALLVPFAETVLFRHTYTQTGRMLAQIQRAKAESVWERGLFLGRAEANDEIIVGTERSVYQFPP